MIRRLLILALQAPLYLYRYTISPLLGAKCRFQPSCSAYAIEALAQHGPIRGVALTLRRLVRCRPGGGSGYDPVPDRFDRDRPDA